MNTKNNAVDNRTTAEKITAIIGENLERERRDNAIYNIAYSTFKRFDGKAITKRMATALEKALNEAAPKFTAGLYRVVTPFVYPLKKEMAPNNWGEMEEREIPDTAAAPIHGGTVARWRCYYSSEYGSYKISCAPVISIGYDTRSAGEYYPDTGEALTLYLGGSGDGIFTLDGPERDAVSGRRSRPFAETSCFAGAAAAKRIDNRRAFLSDTAAIEKLAAAIDTYNAARVALLGADGFSGGLLDTWDDAKGEHGVPDSYAVRRLMLGEDKK